MSVYVEEQFGDVSSTDDDKCENASYHVVECIDRVTDSGIHYARIVQSGMSLESLYRAEYLKVYINAPKAFLQFNATIVNADGTIPIDAKERTEIFDAILSKLKFFEPKTQ